MAPFFWLSLLSAIASVEAFWRLPCGRIQIGRYDPIISPGSVSGHVHTISGPINFDISTTFESLTNASCTSCRIQADKSAYWSPQLYYRYANDTFKPVKGGGTTVYYLDRGDNLADMIPFPPGLKMVSGDPTRRSYDNATLTWSGQRPVADRVNFACINYNNPQAETNGLNNTYCPQGLRAQIHFQSCWDGVNLYKTDQSHVAYLDRIDNGACPPSHPKLLPHLFYEVFYSLDEVQPEQGGYYVFAQGDATGYGFHGDFQNGWNNQVLTDAIAQCMGPNAVNSGGTIEGCPPFTASLDSNSGDNCPLQPSMINETVSGFLNQLPGCNQPSFGPGRASMQVCPVQPNVLASAAESSLGALPYPGDRVGDLAYVGCAKGNPQVLSGPSYSDRSNLSIDACAAFCRQNRFTLAGLKNGEDCSCGNVIMASLQSIGQCSAPGVICSSNAAGQFCGGKNDVLHVWNDTASTVRRSEMPKAGITRLDVGGTQATYGGCYVEADGRALRGASLFNNTGMTNEQCGSFCQSKGFPIFGTEYSQECYCGNSIATQNTTESDCTMVCKGDTSQFCGGGARLSVWSMTLAVSSSSTSSTNMRRTSTTTTTSTSTAAIPTVSGGNYLGCVSETDPRALNAGSKNGDSQTLETCAQFARDKNYRYFGLEYSSECYVDDYINPSSQNISESNCKMTCKANKQQICGGSKAISLFSNLAYVPRIPLLVQINSSSTYTYKGCYADQGNPRTLQGYTIDQNSNTVDSCIQLCFNMGYTFAGAEYGKQCFCGSKLTTGATLKGDLQCSMPCAANARQNCGGSMALQVYQLQTSS